MDNLEWIKSMLHEDEAIAEFTVAGMRQTGYCIVPANVSSESIDVAQCLKETLHRIIEAGDQSDVPSDAVTDETIRSVLLANKEKGEDESGPLELDLLSILYIGYRIHGLITAVKRVPLTAVGFEKKLYERYKLIWMIDHGITLFDAFAEWRDYCDPANGFDGGESSKSAFEDWEYNCGFSGSLYPCFEEYLETDYQVEEMRVTLTADDQKCWKLDQPRILKAIKGGASA